MIEEYNKPQELDFTTSGEGSVTKPNMGNDAVALPTPLTTVDVDIKKIAERQRQITAKVQIPKENEIVWKVLTDYEALAEFIPNLAKSRKLKHPSGGIRVEQIGAQRFLGLNFCARVVLDLVEHFPKEISFRMVEGDFKDFYGSWHLEPCSVGQEIRTNLYYTICIWPKLTMPVSMIERRLSQDLQANLLAVSQRVQQITA